MAPGCPNMTIDCLGQTNLNGRNGGGKRNVLFEVRKACNNLPYNNNEIGINILIKTLSDLTLFHFPRRVFSLRFLNSSRIIFSEPIAAQSINGIIVEIRRNLIILLCDPPPLTTIPHNFVTPL